MNKRTEKNNRFCATTCTARLWARCLAVGPSCSSTAPVARLGRAGRERRQGTAHPCPRRERATWQENMRPVGDLFDRLVDGK